MKVRAPGLILLVVACLILALLHAATRKEESSPMYNDLKIANRNDLNNLCHVEKYTLGVESGMKHRPSAFPSKFYTANG